MPLLNCPFQSTIGYCMLWKGMPFSTLCFVWKGMPFSTLYFVWKGMPFPNKMPFHLLMPFHALPTPNMIWQSIEGHALPNISICRSVWKGMPFYALPYHIGVWKGMEGHREGNGHKLEEGRLLSTVCF